MDIQLLGTGSADGWPNPFCRCASCNWARTHEQARGQTSALIDNVVLVDCGPEVPNAASRFGTALDNVHTLAFTHAHPDHVGPAALLFRHWAKRSEPLTVIGPPAVIETCRPWVAPSDPVTFVVANAGATLRVNDYQYDVLAATHEGDEIGPAVLYRITAPDDSRLLYACDTGPLSEETMRTLSGTALDVLLLEETFGELLDHGTDHLNLPTFAQTIARLREIHAVDDTTDVVAVHLSHHNPPTPRLEQQLGVWGARVVPDGSFLQERPKPTPCPQRTLVIGGARSGKSRFAELLVSADPRVTYIATAPSHPDDEEWQARIASHRSRRPATWQVIETNDVTKQLQNADKSDVVLVDCLTLWLTNVLDDTQSWDGDTQRAEAQISALIESWRLTNARVVAVSNEVGSGVVPATRSGRLFRDLQGRLNTLIAAQSDEVVQMVAGRAVVL